MTARGPLTSLDALADDDLKALAREIRLDVPSRTTRGKLIELLAAAPNPDEVLARADRLELESRLIKLPTRQLRDLGARYRVSLNGLARKAELVTALAASPVASDVRMELNALERPGDLATVDLPKGDQVDLARVKDLLDEAQKRFEERRFDDAIAAAREAAHRAERTSRELARASWSYSILAAMGLLEPCNPRDPDTAAALDLLTRVKTLYAQGKLEDETVLQDLVKAAQTAHGRDASRVRADLADVRDAIREAANIGASVANAEADWRRASDLLDRGDLRAARETADAAGRAAAEARDRRIQDVTDALASIEDAIALARNVGADPGDAVVELEDARTASRRGDYLRAGESAKRAERLAMQSQQRQIEQAMEIRQAQVDRAQTIIEGCETLIHEAETYGIGVAEARTLLRQAQDVLAKGDTIAAVTLARNAEEAAERLEPRLLEERRRRGIGRPTSGLCGVCASPRLEFREDGWGRCLACGSSFRWRGPLGVLERVRGLLGT